MVIGQKEWIKEHMAMHKALDDHCVKIVVKRVLEILAKLRDERMEIARMPGIELSLFEDIIKRIKEEFNGGRNNKG